MGNLFENIVFFYPSKITGGAEYLFLRCSEYLAENQSKYNIYISDYADGFLKRNVKSPKIKFIEHQKGMLTSIPDKSLVVVQLNLLINVKEKLQFDDQKTRVLYWCLHTLNLKPNYYVNGIYMLRRKERMQLGQVVRQLTSMNVIKFMALSTYCKVGNDLGLKAEEFSWLPNIAPINHSIAFPSIKAPDRIIRFCWLGRLDEEKAHNIATYMNEIESLSYNRKVSLSIIGLGKAETMLKEKAATLHYEISFVGEKRDDALDEFIRENVDVGLASGTSALEFSLRGKPVIIESVIPREFPAGERNSYFLTSEMEKYTISNAGNFTRTCTSTFKDKLDQILSDYETICRECFDFVISRGPSNCCQNLLKAVDDIGNVKTDEMLSLISKASELLRTARKRIDYLIRIKRLFVWS